MTTTCNKHLYYIHVGMSGFDAITFKRCEICVMFWSKSQINQRILHINKPIESLESTESMTSNECFGWIESILNIRSSSCKIVNTTDSILFAGTPNCHNQLCHRNHFAKCYSTTKHLHVYIMQNYTSRISNKFLVKIDFMHTFDSVFGIFQSPMANSNYILVKRMCRIYALFCSVHGTNAPLTSLKQEHTSYSTDHFE